MPIRYLFLFWEKKWVLDQGALGEWRISLANGLVTRASKSAVWSNVALCLLGLSGFKKLDSFFLITSCFRSSKRLFSLLRREFLVVSLFVFYHSVKDSFFFGQWFSFFFNLFFN